MQKINVMKSKSTILISVLMGMLVFFSACEDDNDYDYDAIIPIVMDITGPGVVAAHGLTEFPTRYHVPHRGGSTFEWSVTTAGGRGATIVLDDQFSSIAYITFDQSDEADVATISVVETTMGGITSDPGTRQISLEPFCPYDMDALVGEWTGTAGAHDEVLHASKTANLNELRMTGLAGFVNFAWGEAWVEGDGSAVLEFSCGDVVTIHYQHIGDSDFPDVYHMDGEGTFDPDTKTIELSYVVYYTGASSGPHETTLTHGSKGWQEVSRDETVPVR